MNYGIFSILGQLTKHVSIEVTVISIPFCFRYAHPVPFGIQRKSLQSSHLCGYPIPKNTVLLINLWGHHHDSAIWQDPYTFRPERFLTQNRASLLPLDHPNQVNLLPFGVGSRKCPAYQLGIQHLFLMAATILKHFTVCPADTDLNQPSCDPRKSQVGIVMMPAKYKIRLKRRTEHTISRSSTPTSTSSTVDSWLT